MYVVGFSNMIEKLSDDVLKSKKYFGKYGTVTKITFNQNKIYNRVNVYVQYTDPIEVMVAIQVSHLIIDS